MPLGIIRPLRSLAAVLLANDSPRQIAAGATIGMVLGLTPAGNLLSVALGVLLLALRVNRTAGLVVAAGCAFAAPMLDGFTHRLGEKLLSIDSLQAPLAWLYDQPLGPWIGFNNTVVLGSFVLGLYLLYPCYLLARLTLDRVQAPVAAWMRRWRVARWLLGADVTSRWAGPANLGAGS